MEIVEANTNRDLTTLAAVKAEFGDSGVSDGQLERFITQASDVIARYCNRVFAIETVKETFRLQGHRSDVMLRRYPVTEIVSVTMNGQSVDAALYQIDRESGIMDRLECQGAAAWWSGSVVVTYKAGFALPDDLPEGIERACITLVKNYAASGDRDPMVRSESSDGVGSTAYFSGEGSGLPPEVEGLISLHRVPNA